MAEYEAQFRSKTKEIFGMPTPRPFGGMESGGLLYRFESVRFTASNDQEALSKARKMAGKKKMILLTVAKPAVGVWKIKKRDAVC